MAGVAPNGNIWLLRGVPIDMAHTKTYRPKSAADQFTAFSAYKKYTLTEQTYIRHSINSIRVEYSADDVIDCNYMIFQNSAFSNKYFYAFITDVEYVSNNTCRIVFEIDNLQTYYFDIDFLPSLIAREHSATDNIGDSVTPEPILASGQEIYSNPQAFQHDANGLYTVVVTTKDLLNPTQSRVYTTFTHFTLGGLVMAGAYNVCNVTSESLSDFANVITNYIETAGGLGEIIAIYAIPKDAYPNGNWDSTHSWLAPIVNPNMPDPKYYEVVKPTKGDTLDGYSPSNAKLYTYPYCFLRVSDYRGATKDFRYEYMGDGSHFRVVNSGIMPAPSEQLTALGYAGTDTQMSEWDNAMWISNYPTPTFSVSEFSDYYGANHNSQIAKQLSNIFTSVVAGVTAGQGASGYQSDSGETMPVSNPINNVTSAINNAITFYGKQQDLINRTSVINANQSSFLSLMYGRDLFGTYRVCFNKTVLQMYDDYFTRFGYAVNRIKVPYFWNALGRTKYNYCKTQEANIRSKSATTGVPMGALSDITNIFNNGICLWENMSEVGFYSNNPVRE